MERDDFGLQCRLQCLELAASIAKSDPKIDVVATATKFWEWLQASEKPVS